MEVFNMNRLQKIQLRQSEVQGFPGRTPGHPGGRTRRHLRQDDRDKLTKEMRSLESDVGAAIAAGEDVVEEVSTKDTSEGREYRELRSSVDFGRYVSAAMGGHGVTSGAELELNQHLGIADGYFPDGIIGGQAGNAGCT